MWPYRSSHNRTFDGVNWSQFPKPMRLPAKEDVAGHRNEHLAYALAQELRQYLLRASDVVYGMELPLLLSCAIRILIFAKSQRMHG